MAITSGDLRMFSVARVMFLRKCTRPIRTQHVCAQLCALPLLPDTVLQADLALPALSCKARGNFGLVEVAEAHVMQASSASRARGEFRTSAAPEIVAKDEGRFEDGPQRKVRALLRVR